jgi:hypothetical protein
MKIVINACYGGFGLSDAAVEECVRKGMILTEYDENGSYINPDAYFCKIDSSFGKYYCNEGYGEKRNALRSHPVLVEVVESMGEKADGQFAELKVVDIPFDTTEGWEITEYDGYERVEEIHRSWS